MHRIYSITNVLRIKSLCIKLVKKDNHCIMTHGQQNIKKCFSPFIKYVSSIEKCLLFSKINAKRNSSLLHHKHLRQSGVLTTTYGLRRTFRTPPGTDKVDSRTFLNVRRENPFSLPYTFQTAPVAQLASFPTGAGRSYYGG